MWYPSGFSLVGLGWLREVMRAFQNGAYGSGKQSDHRRKRKYRHITQGIFPSTASDTKTCDSTLSTTATPPTDASTMWKIWSSSQLIPTPSRRSTNGSRANHLDSARFCRMCLDVSHRQAQSPIIRMDCGNESPHNAKKTWITCPKTTEKIRQPVEKSTAALNRRPQHEPVGNANKMRTYAPPARSVK